MAANDLTGKRFGRLVVMHSVPKPEGYKWHGTWWHCKCDCGNEVDKPGQRLVGMQVTSCGCKPRGLKASAIGVKNKIHDDCQFVQAYTRRLTTEDVCPECKKKFERTSAEWGYTMNKRRYCSYKCMRAAEVRTGYKKRRRFNGNDPKAAED